MSDAPKILLLRRRGLGDLLVSLDLLRALRARWPDARVEVVVDRAFASVLQHCPGIDAMRVYDASRMRRLSAPRRLRAAWQWMEELRAQNYDIVLDLMGTPQTALWTRRSGAGLRVGVERRWRSHAYNRLLRGEGGSGRFAGERALDFARALGIDPGHWRPARLAEAPLPSALESLFSGGNAPFVGLNPSATWEAKAWPAEHWAELARRLAERLPSKPLLIWGPGDEFRRDAILRLAPAACVALPATSLAELSAVLSRLDLLISTDSGPKHLAVATATPTLTLFGSTDPRGWQPDLPEHVEVHDDELPCRPCDLRDCPLDGHPCMTGLQPGAILELAMGRLEVGHSHG